MDLEKPKFEGSKLVTTWWDLVDQYLLAVMFAVSVASVGLQATQDRLICIPAVNCSDLARNDSVVPRWSERSRMSNICNRSPSFVVLTTMPDRRQYDYVDNECYGKMDGFSACYSLIFLAETVILLAISNFWQKCPDLVNALAYCEHLLSEFITGEFSAKDEKSDLLEASEDEQREKLKKQREIIRRLHIFQVSYSQKIAIFNLSSLTCQYRLRGVVGLIATIVALLVNAIYYSLTTGWTQCQLDGLAAVSATHRFFQCTRSMGAYFHAGSISYICLLSLHLIFVSWTILWSVTGERRGPRYELRYGFEELLYLEGDAAFFFSFYTSFKLFSLRQIRV
ncbi:volume-regulated anion channel subunit LRRC8A-like [Acropora millepora]|uniref:volume-regulated anion channel subunit LRRC8A-like n=1 Tax=Acropora millepora TaxID=45264 RepID=UPI001CF5F81D|nr:volume-regulated anion channel subunit LRRC8A-like [Acropora millepora]